MAPGIIQIFVKGLQGGTTAIDIHKVSSNIRLTATGNTCNGKMVNQSIVGH